ncbi:MAG: glycosyltransferase family 9 protein [bacterium]
MRASDIKHDCRHFRGAVPCAPNKLRGKVCDTCDEYNPVRTRILLIKLGAAGDVIRTTPLLQRFREEYPGAHVTWLTLTPEVLPASRIDKIYKFDFKSVYTLRQLPFDLVVNLDKDLEACALLEEISATKKFGFGLKDGRLCAVNELAEHKLLTGAFDQLSRQSLKSYLEEIFEICGFDFRGEPYVLEVEQRHQKIWEELHQKAQGRSIIGLNTGCGERWLTRLWPEDYWLALIRILQRQNYFPLLLGGPAEEERNMHYAQKSGAYYPGTYALQRFMALSAQCHVIVTAVTMMMHLAIGLRIPLVLFNNIFNPYEFELYGHGIMLQPESGCDCYFGNTCTRARHCMSDLHVETVFAAIEKLAQR